MRTVSAAWLTNQTEDIACPSRLDAWVDTTDGVTPRHWIFSNSEEAENVIEATVESIFDPTRDTFPVDSCSITIENAAFESDDAVAAADYDFTLAVNKTAIANPGQMGIQLGYAYDTGGYDAVLMTEQKLDSFEMSDDQTSATARGVSFTLRLDSEKFYDGCHHPNGISAHALFRELLDAMFTTEKPGWAYRVGQTTCKVSNTVTLWDRDTTDLGDWGYVLGAAACKVSNDLSLFSMPPSPYYTLDDALRTVLVYLPIPPMTYREALVRLAAYAGAWILHRSDGTIEVTTSLGSRLDYHFDVDRVYDVPRRESGEGIGAIKGKLHGFSGIDEASGTSQSEGSQTVATFLPADYSTQEFRVTHDPYDGAALTLVGATLVTVEYNTYSTVFTATPTAATVTATVIGYPATMTDAEVTQTYGDGTTVEIDNPLASDRTMTLAMLDHYHSYANATSYVFTMRDDPAVEVGDRCYLDTLDTPAGIPVIVASIKRSFNGGCDGEYTVIVDPVA